MRFVITGRNIDVTEGLRSAVTEKIGKLERYFTPDTEVIVTLSVEKERIIDSIKFTNPRTMGMRKKECFFFAETNLEFFVTVVPSSLRTVSATLSPLFIITPSSTAWPPTLPRFSGT